MAQTNNHSYEIGLEPLSEQVKEVAGIMKDNRDKVLEREGKLSDLDTRADNLNKAATKFNSNATAVRKKMWWENVKTKFCIGVSSFVIVILILIVVLHQFGFLSTSSSGSQPESEIKESSKEASPLTPSKSDECIYDC